MARPRKTRKINHGVNRTRMDDLDDYMLTQILLRLPNCKTVLSCSPVNKRWRSLISDPNFPDQFVNHEKKTTTLLKGSPWSFITTFWPRGQILITEFKPGWPKLSLEFLPCDSPTATATFKDLVLCASRVTDRVGSRVYYITNPLTKQWVALPPCRLDKHQRKWINRPTLICQSTYNHTRDYNFRVVLVRHHPRQITPHEFNLVVYCSEIGEWKVINLRIPEEAGPLGRWDQEHEACFNMFVVCNGIIYFKSGLCLVALDPFDVNASCGLTLEARVMPPLPNFGYLQESSGQLLVIHSPKERQGLPFCLWYKKDNGSDIELNMTVWKLDPNQVPFEWEMAFNGLCKGIWYSSICNPPLPSHNIYANEIGVHPYNDKLIYINLDRENLLVLCDTQTRCIMPSNNLPKSLLSRFDRLEHQWWPTSIPALVQCLAVEQNLPPPSDN